MKLRAKILVAALVVLVASAGAYYFLVLSFSRSQTLQTQKRAAFIAGTLDDALGRLEHLPFVISQDSVVREALERASGEALNPVLKTIAARAGASHIFLMDLNGKTIAASNYQSRDSFVGNFYTFRPYFRDAILGGTGHFYAIGATTGKPGYFVSAPVRDRLANIFGVIVVKVGLDALNRAWQDSGEQILVSNKDGVVVLASNPAFQFRTLRTLTPYTLQNLENAQQFGSEPLQPLDWQAAGSGQVSLNGAEYLLAQVRITREDWTLHLLTGLSGIRQRAALAILAVWAMGFAVIVAITSFRSARLKAALKQSDADRARLGREIEVRRMAEAELRATQGELERAGRLAALGQLSASVIHELGQPISAMRNYLAAEEITAEAKPDSLHPLLSGLVTRMQNTIRQLRYFAAPGGAGEVEVFNLCRAADASLELVAHGIAEAGVTLRRNYGTPDLPVRGNRQQIEQVLVNLLRNALDAVAQQQVREITVSAGTAGGDVFVSISDSGPGLEGRSLAELQEPFMTTKPSGKGMGLGLAISTRIAKDMNGRITARDQKNGGAVFTLWLPVPGDLP